MAKKTTYVSDVQLTYKPSTLLKCKINGSLSAAEICRDAIPEDQIGLREFFGVLLLNRGGWVVARTILFTGGISGVVVDVRLVLQTALLANATGMILFHNHPSGRVVPSEDDRKRTIELFTAGKVMKIEVIDHIILSGVPDMHPSYYSFSDEGLL